MLKNISGPEGPHEVAQGGAMAPVPPLGYVTDRNHVLVIGSELVGNGKPRLKARNKFDR